MRIAVIVNDFAEVNVDAEAILSSDCADGVVALSNGCLCCSIKEGFRDSVWDTISHVI